MEIERKQTTIQVWNVCQCGRMLHSIAEGKRGSCGSCWLQSIPKDTVRALNRVIGAAFRNPPPTSDEKGKLIDDAMNRLKELDSPPLARCSACGRGTWEPDVVGAQCRMSQPSGEKCRGEFVICGDGV